MDLHFFMFDFRLEATVSTSLLQGDMHQALSINAAQGLEGIRDNEHLSTSCEIVVFQGEWMWVENPPGGGGIHGSKNKMLLCWVFNLTHTQRGLFN